jgi:hypothetical protein
MCHAGVECECSSMGLGRGDILVSRMLCVHWRGTHGGVLDTLVAGMIVVRV